MHDLIILVKLIPLLFSIKVFIWMLIILERGKGIQGQLYGLNVCLSTSKLVC